MNDIENKVNDAEVSNEGNPFVPASEGKKENSTAADEKFVFNETTITAALSYVWILVFVPFFMKKDNPFIRFHVKQGLVVLGLSLVYYLIGSLPVINMFALIIKLITILLSLYGLYNVFLQKTVPLPVIGKLADKIDI